MPSYKNFQALSVKSSQFGAVGDGVNNDTAEIQAAINAASALGAGTSRGGAVYFPPGNYAINNVLINPGDVTMVGASEGSEITAMAGFPTTTTQNIFGQNYTFPTPMLWISSSATPDHARGLYDLHFNGNNFLAPVGLMMTRMASWGVHNIRCHDMSKDGIVLDGLQNSSFFNCRPTRCQRHGIFILNATRYITNFGCFTRDCGETSVCISGINNTYPASGGGIGTQTQNIQFIGGLLEEELEGFNRQHVIKITDGERHAFYSVSMVRSASVSYVLVQGAPNCTFHHCSIVGGGADGETSPAFRIEAQHCEIINPWFNQFDGARNLIEVTVAQGLRLVNPRILGSTLTSGGKYVACIPSLDSRFVRYVSDTPAGTSAQRPSMTLIDAVADYYDTTLNKPIWWNPVTPTWKDATGANV